MKNQQDLVCDPKSKLQWFQFSLKTLLIVVTLVAIPCSWLAVKLKEAKEQREAVAEIEKLGGKVVYDWQYAPLPSPQLPGPKWLRSLLGDDLFQTVISVGFIDPKFTNAGLERLESIGLPKLRYFGFGGTQITDAGLEHLKAFSKLQFLGLDRTQVTDAGLEHLKGFSELQGLNLDRTQITDAGLEHLIGLGHLQRLSLNYTQVTDAGLEHLKGLPQLRVLRLLSTQVTDAGLEHLKRLSQLKELYVDSTKVTEAGVTKLRRTLPGCTIEH